MNALQDKIPSTTLGINSGEAGVNDPQVNNIII